VNLTEQQMAEAVEAMQAAYMARPKHDGAMEAALTAALPIIERAVRADYEANLADPVFVRLNMLRGGIARPDDLVWLHDTNGPVAAKVRNAECEIWLAAAERAESRMDACDVLALTTSSEQTIVEARIRESAYRVVAEEFRALAEEARG